MQKWLRIAGICFAVLIASGAAAQETRGNISGTVRDRDGVVPGATVKITNTSTSVSQQLVTNNSGYFEAPLLIAGSYEVNVEMPSFKVTTDGHHARGRPIGDTRHHARARTARRAC